MVDFDFSKHCCGCGACADACPRQCISIVEDTKDFRIPKINTELCVNCGRCDSVCPIINNEAISVEKKLYCCYNKNSTQRKEGSSGSLFVLLAQEVLAEGGVVIGAGFDSQLQLRHQVAGSLNEVKSLMKSKYIQSDTTGIFIKVRDFLREGRKVLFVGTPCQCQALYNYIGSKNLDNLLLVDFICHGVPSQKLFDKSIRSFELKNRCKILSFSFREKAKGSLHCYKMSYMYDDDDEVIVDVGKAIDFPYYYGYLKYVSFRESCYECPLARQDRISDLTLGDFWGIASLNKSITDFRKGYSMMIVNTEKGKQYYQRISPHIESKEYPVNLAENNYAYTHPTKKRLQHKLFIRDYNVKPYEIVEENYLKAPNSLFRLLLMYVIDKFKL